MTLVLVPNAGPVGQELRLQQSGGDLGARIADVVPGSGPQLVGRYTVSNVGPGSALTMALGQTGESPFPIVSNRLQLGRGRFVVGVSGDITTGANGMLINYHSTTAGGNLIGINLPATHALRGCWGVAAWTALDPLEEFWMLYSSTPAPPNIMFNNQLYVVRLGDAP